MGQTYHEIEQKLIEKAQVIKQRVMNNRLLLVSSLNILTFLSMVFALCFYQWIWVEILVKVSIKNKNTNDLFYIKGIWVNLLYAKQQTQTTYSTFSDASDQICLRQDIQCLTYFNQFAFVGYISFGFFALAGVMHLIDFIKIVLFIRSKKPKYELKDHFRHFVSICAHIIGITLSTFSMWAISPVDYTHGVSFWIQIGALICFILVVIYEKIAIRKLQKKKLILDLIQEEKKIRKGKLEQKTERQSGTGSQIEDYI